MAKNLILVIAFALAVAATAQESIQETTLADQTDVAVTAYNNGLALVRDTREINLATGELQLRFAGVAEQIRPETVSLRSLSSPGSLRVIEQNYEYDLMSPEKLMEKYVGKRVALVNFSTEIGFQRVEAELLTNNGPVYKVGQEIYLGHPGNVVLPEVPEDLIAKPSLIWTLDNGAASQKVEATYLTGGVSWKADYVVTLAKDDSSLNLNGWVTMDNQSGATYTNAQLKLVAGEVNIAPRALRGDFGGKAELALSIGAAPMPVEEAFGEYHLYTMPRRTTIKQNQSKQLALLEAEGVKSMKKYEFRGEQHYFISNFQPITDQHVAVYLEFENEEANGLGLPVPAGVMRIYQEDSEGMLQFAGEDRIKHTPKDETVRLKMGEAFDVVADRKQTDFQMLADRLTESAFEIKVRNHKDTAVTVEVVEPMVGDWEILDSSHKFEKRDAFTAVFALDVPPDGETVLTYRARIKQ